MMLKEMVVKIYRCMLDFGKAIVKDVDEYEAMRSFVEFDELLHKISEATILEEIEEDLYYYRRLVCEVLSLWADYEAEETYDGDDEINLEKVENEINIRTDEIWEVIEYVRPAIMRAIAGVQKVIIYDEDFDDAA